jgi:unsaturated rhamnogalacturonyl hydrolase
MRSTWTRIGTAHGDVIDVCASTDIGDLKYYLNRPRLQGDLHGFGPFLLAGSEIIRLRRTGKAAGAMTP